MTTEPQECEWREEDPWGPMPDTYATDCGEMWSFVDGGPAENRVKFCHRCGKTVTVVPYPQPVDEDDADCVAPAAPAAYGTIAERAAAGKDAGWWDAPGVEG